MKPNTWTRYLVAAALVLLVGAVWVLAEEIEMKVEVRNDGGQEITVDVNGVVEVIELDDLAEGEERSYDVGGHPIVVRRVDDQLTLVHDGHPMHGLKHIGEADEDLIWVTEGFEGDVVLSGDCENDGHRVMIIKKGDGDVETIDIESAPHVMKWHSDSGEGGPMIVKSGPHFMHGDFVHYRCEETGSMLMVKKDDALLDSYVDPVTGCLMEKVESPKRRINVIVHEIKDEDENSDD